jgi:hypothetical protein
MPTLYNVQLWLKHAEEARALSRVLADPRTKQHMLAIAARFERIAGLANELRSTSASSINRQPLGSLHSVLQSLEKKQLILTTRPGSARAPAVYKAL